MLTVLVAMVAATLTTHAQEASGTCGDNLNWSYDGAGTLTITGTGDMTDFATTDAAPWYDYRADITSVSLPDGLTHIGKNAFYQCNNASLTTIPIPSTVTSIGYGAFWYCGGLTSITLPEGLTSVGIGAFRSSGLTSITIPSSMTSLPSSMFEKCTSLTSVTIPNTVTEINSSAFKNCSSLLTITLPEGLTTIYIETFSGCSSLTSINLPSGLTTIYELAFKNCSSLASIDIPSSVTSIGYYAFGGCTGLTDVTVNWTDLSSVNASGDAFFNPFSTPDRTMNLHVPYGKGSTYSETSPWNKSYFNIVEMNPQGKCGENLYWEYDPSTTTLTITGTGAMYDYTNASYQPWNAYASDITTVDIESGATSIGNFTFRGCSSLASVTIPSSVISIGAYAFSQCTSLTSIEIPNGVTTIGQSVFRESTGLQSVILPNSVTSIGQTAFYNCTSLNSINIPSSVTSIGAYTFYQCTGLTSVDIPNSVTSIGGSAFFQCISLQSVTLPENLTTIEPQTFVQCTSLTSITIPNSVTTIGNFAFNSSGLVSITIPNSVTSIGMGALRYCSSLQSVTLPENLTTIDQVLFLACTSLESITIPSSVTSIGYYAFGGCTGLTDVTVNWTDLTGVTTDAAAFQDVTVANVNLHIPYGTLSMYEAAPVWQDFLLVPVAADYMRPALTAGKIGTLYVGHATTSYEGATFYSIVGKSADGRSLTFEEVTGQLEDDKPYIFEATGEDIKLYYADKSHVAPDGASANGLYGTLTEKHVGPSENIYYISNNQLWRANGFTGGATDLTVGANRCWIDITQVPVLNAAPAPGRRYITLRTDGEMTATGIEEVGSETANAVRSEKILRDGQLLIIRGDKTYSITGQIVK